MRVMPEEKFGLTLEKGQKQQTELNFLGSSVINTILWVNSQLHKFETSYVLEDKFMRPITLQRKTPIEQKIIAGWVDYSVSLYHSLLSYNKRTHYAG